MVHLLQLWRRLTNANFVGCPGPYQGGPEAAAVTVRPAMSRANQTSGRGDQRRPTLRAPPHAPAPLGHPPPPRPSPPKATSAGRVPPAGTPYRRMKLRTTMPQKKKAQEETPENPKPTDFLRPAGNKWLEPSGHTETLGRTPRQETRVATYYQPPPPQKQTERRQQLECSSRSSPPPAPARAYKPS
ncbi:basic salivary proline-rich protein 3-like [Homalodisca vitripennis]|uniref:basic salivary proline-rich protein 3-like n=1 Tax=Homalodisca vitripennis TaxID=197043 RepID=UPI001EEC2AFF|nr:basic salivary proline-rich protein 3-like [Homalodisca vitripennis]